MARPEKRVVLPVHSSQAHAHVHVIGRGIVGLSIAFALQRRGVRVRIVGPAAKLGSATVAAVGTSTLKGNILATSPLFTLKMRGHAGLVDWLDSIEKASDRAVSRDFSGAFEPFYNQKEYVYQRKRVFHRQFTGCFALKILDQKALSGRFSSGGLFPRQALGAFHYFRDGWYDPLTCLAALEEALKRGGADFLSGQVVNIKPNPMGGQLIQTDAGCYEAQQTVLAAGVFSDEILAASGFSGIRQEAVEGETVIMDAPQLNDMVLKLGKMNLVVHAGVVRVGSSSRRQADLLHCQASGPAAQELADLAATLVGASPVFSSAWGIRGRFKDHCPAIGSLKWANFAQPLWLATGFYKNGLQLAPLFAEKLADLMLVTPSLSTAISTAFPQPMSSILS